MYYVSSVACASCTSQVGCTVDTGTCLAFGGHTKLACETASVGYFVAAPTAVPRACNTNVDFSAVPSVIDGSCTRCAEGTTHGCTQAECSPGYHSFASGYCTALLAYIRGGSARTVRQAANFSLTVVTNAPAHATALLEHGSWSCAQSGTLHVALTSSSTDATWTVNASELAFGVEYTCEATVTLRGHSVTASTKVRIAPAAVSITSVAHESKADPGRALKLLGSIQPADGAPLQQITLQWVIKAFGPGASFQGINLATNTGLQSSNLVVPPGQLQPGRAYRFTLQVPYLSVLYSSTTNDRCPTLYRGGRSIYVIVR